MPSSAHLDPAPDPRQLPSPGDAERWLWLQALRRLPRLPLEPWLVALETGAIAAESDLLACLLPHGNGAELARLLEWWVRQPDPVPPLPRLPGPWRDAVVAQRLRQLLEQPLAPQRQAALLALLGHQREAVDATRLCRLLEQPGARAVRHGALEGLSLGLAAWPRRLLRGCLERVATDLDPELAAGAVDLLDRLPAARLSLIPLGRRALEPEVAARLRRRIARRGADPLLLVVHGRSGGLVPPELVELAAELEQRRGAPVALQALTAEPPGVGPHRSENRPLGLVPLLLLPGSHVRTDLPALRANLQRSGPVRCWPFLGAWTAWQQALAEELAGLAATGQPPWLLHHPLEEGLPSRYLSHLTHCTAAVPVAAAAQDVAQRLEAKPCGAGMAPLALARCRLTEALSGQDDAMASTPLLCRPALRAVLLDLLESLP
ncbi:MAG: hypothetical protein VKO00_10120 [Cyanobacteriota bacterium]|nr:hypothetical protein [Cyanobacteriota bacterium]